MQNKSTQELHWAPNLMGVFVPICEVEDWADSPINCPSFAVYLRPQSILWSRPSETVGFEAGKQSLLNTRFSKQVVSQAGEQIQKGVGERQSK